MELTPVQNLGGYYFKRDDLYRPFLFSPINGTKLRQCVALVNKNRECASRGIITGTSVLSPQAAITATVAKAMGYRCTILYGGTTEDGLMRYEYPRLCKRLGANVTIASASGMTTVLNAICKKRVAHTGELNIKYGFDLRNNIDVFIQSVAQQVANVPDGLDSISLVVGSAITLIGVLCGIAMYEKDVKKIVGVGCAPNRMTKIKEYAAVIKQELGISLPLDRLEYVDAFAKYKGFKYENTMENVRFHGITFHPRYEAKAFKYVYNMIPRNERNLFWINGAPI